MSPHCCEYQLIRCWVSSSTASCATSTLDAAINGPAGLGKTMTGKLPIHNHNIGPDTPLRLDRAVELAFPAEPNILVRTPDTVQKP